MKHTLLPIILAIVTFLSVPGASSRAQGPGNYDLHDMPAAATLHDVTAVPAEYKGRKALRIEFTEAVNKSPPGVDLLFDMPTFVLIPGNFKNGTIEVDVLGRLNGKGLPDARGEHAKCWGLIRPPFRWASGRRSRAGSHDGDGGRRPRACRSARRCAPRGRAAGSACSSASAAPWPCARR